MHIPDHLAYGARRPGFQLALSVMAAVVVACLAPAVACGQTSDADATTSPREGSYSSRGPSPGHGRENARNSWWDEGLWYASVSAGPAGVGGDGRSGSARFP